MARKPSQSPSDEIAWLSQRPFTFAQHLVDERHDRRDRRSVRLGRVDLVGLRGRVHH
jgi:hypothetical protein